MTPEQLRDIMHYLEQRVRWSDDRSSITFDEPDETTMTEAGLDPSGVRRLLAQAWWPEMVEEIVETPDFCAPDDPPDRVLGYARDVVSEYIRKRFPLEDR
jgi:hypothetical protein